MSAWPTLKSCDAIIAIDARGFLFGAAIAKTTKKPLVLARKKNKLPGKVIENNYGFERKIFYNFSNNRTYSKSCNGNL